MKGAFARRRFARRRRQHPRGGDATPFNWQMVETLDEEWVDCLGGPLRYKVIGVVTAPVDYGQSPSYAMILEGGGFKGNSFYGCPERPQLK